MVASEQQMESRTSFSPRLFRPVILVFLAFTWSCGAATPQPEGLALDDQTKCKVAADATSPLVTEWPAGEKARLERMLAAGPVVVRYSGCELTLIERCTLEGAYNFTRTTLATDTLDIENEDELYAKLPLGAASLEGELVRTGRLAVRTTVAGQYKLEAADEPKMKGTECRSATHVVEAVSIGAFLLVTGGRTQGGGSVVVAGGSHHRDERVVREAGIRKSCEQTGDEPHPQCNSPIQLFLRPLFTRTAGNTGATRTSRRTPPKETSALRPWTENFQSYEVGDSVPTWGPGLSVFEDESGRRFLTSQIPGLHRASQSVPMGRNFVFEFTWTSFDYRQNGSEAPWVRIAIGFTDTAGKRFELSHGNWGLALPGRPVVDFYEGRVNRFRMVRSGDHFKFFHGEKFLASGTFSGFGPFVGFDIVVPVAKQGKSQRFTDFSLLPLGAGQ